MASKNDRYKETIEVYKRLGKEYAKKTEEVVPQEIFEFIKLLPKEGKILDVGCCGGRDSKTFSEKGFKVIGIDVVKSFLEEARRNVPKAKFIKMDLLKLKFPKNYFDAIWAHAILLHVKRKDVPKVLKDFYRIIKSKGILHIRAKKGRGTYYKKDKLSNKEKRMFTYFTKKEIERFVKEAGFKIITSRILADEHKRKDVKWISLWAKK